MINDVRCRVRDIGLGANDILSIEYSYQQGGILQATITTYKKPSAQPENLISIETSLHNQTNLTRVFTGYIDRIEFQEDRGVYTITARDVLKKALDTFLLQEVAFGVDVEAQKYYYTTYTAQQGGTFTIHEYNSLSALHANHPETVGNIRNEGVYAHAVVQWLLVMCGIPEGTNIQVANSNFYIGDIKPVRFYLVSVYDAIQQIVDLLGWDFYADPYGICRFHPKRINYFGDLYTITNDIVLQHSVVQSNEDLRNYVEVIGASGIRVVVRAPSPYTGSTPYRGVLISNEMIDTPQIANFVANRVLNELNRLKITHTFTLLPAFPLSPTTRFRYQNTTLRIENYQGRIDQSGYLLNLTLTGFVENSDYDDPEPSISADFTANYEATFGDPTILFRLDGSLSTSSLGPITQWNWTVTAFDPIQNANATTTGSGQVAFFTADKNVLETQGVNVVLSVRDVANNVATKQKTLYFSSLEGSDKELYRTLYACGPTFLAGSVDGGLTWKMQPHGAHHVSASHYDARITPAQPYALFVGTSSVWRTDNGCESVVNVTPSVGTGNFTTSHIHALQPEIAFLGRQSTLLRSNDAGQTFQLFATFNGVIRCIQTNPENSSIIYVVVTNNTQSFLYVSFDNGQTWTDFITEWGLSSIGTLLYYVGGVQTSDLAIEWLLTTTGLIKVTNGNAVFYPTPEPCVSITPHLTQPHTAFLCTADGKLYTFDQNIFTQTGNASVGISMHIRDGEFPVALYYATTNGIYKSFDTHRTVRLLALSGNNTSWVTYGPLTKPVTLRPGSLIVVGRALIDVLQTESTGLFFHNQLYIALAPSGILGASLQTATRGFVGVTRPDRLSTVYITDVYGPYVFGWFTRFSSPTLTSLQYEHPYTNLRQYPFVFDVRTASGIVNQPRPLSLTVPNIPALTMYTYGQNELTFWGFYVTPNTNPHVVIAFTLYLGGLDQRYMVALLDFPPDFNPTSSQPWLVLQNPFDFLTPRTNDGRNVFGVGWLDNRIRYGRMFVSYPLHFNRGVIVSILNEWPTRTSYFRNFQIVNNRLEGEPFTRYGSIYVGDERILLPLIKNSGVKSAIMSVATEYNSEAYDDAAYNAFHHRNRYPNLQPIGMYYELPAGVLPISMWTSRKPEARIVYAATTQAVLRNDGSGWQTIFTPDPSVPANIRSMTVTMTRDRQHDCIALVCQEGDTARGYIAVSVDSGATWRYHLWESALVHGFVCEAWWVD